MNHIFRRYICMASFIIILAISILCGRTIQIHLSEYQKFDVSFDDFLSEETQKQIISFIQEHVAQRTMHISKSACIIKEHFPCIKSLQIRLVPPATLKLMCVSCSPLYCFNQELLLVSNMSLCHKNMYKPEAYLRLPIISIDQSVLQYYGSEQLHALIKKIGRELFNSYTVVIPDNGNIIFSDIIQPKLQLIQRLENIIPKKIEFYGKYLREMLETRGSFSCRSSVTYVADLRFEKQIILRKKIKEE